MEDQGQIVEKVKNKIFLRLYECNNPHCPHLLQYNQINRRQFKPRGVCKFCGALSSKCLSKARKIWDFPEDSDTFIIETLNSQLLSKREFIGWNSCSYIKPTR